MKRVESREETALTCNWDLCPYINDCKPFHFFHSHPTNHLQSHRKFIWCFLPISYPLPLPITSVPSGHSQLLAGSELALSYLVQVALVTNTLVCLPVCSADGLHLWEQVGAQPCLCPSQWKRCLALVLSSFKLILPKWADTEQLSLFVGLGRDQPKAWTD